MGTVTEPPTEPGRLGQVITFYSFKGGVGRSMALANVAAVYAQRGKRVLVLDFDFEAPGLHRYFLAPEEAALRRHEPTRHQLGMLNFFYALRDRLRANWPDGDGFQDALDQLPTLFSQLLDSDDYLYRISIKNPNTRDAPPVTLDFVAAARFDHTYAELVREFDWQAFYGDYAELFPALARKLGQRYDYVLIDSRTGVTDIGSICTMMLPEKLVLVFTPNDQSLRGALDAGWQAVQGRKQTDDSRPLSLFPLLSRVEYSEEELRRHWLSRVRRDFERLFRKLYPQKQIDLEVYFNIIQIPHRSYYAYGERIATEERRATDTGSLAPAFYRLAQHLDLPDVIEHIGSEVPVRYPARWRPAEPVTSQQHRQILIVVDLFAVTSADELENALPPERRELHVLRLSSFGAPLLRAPGSSSQLPIPWPALGCAVEALVARVFDLCSADSRPVVIFIGGQGPSAVFVHLGYVLSKFGPRQVFIDRQYGFSDLEEFRLDTPHDSEGPLLDYQSGFPTERTFGTGRVALYIDTGGRPAPVEAIHNLLRERGEAMAGLVELRSSKPFAVTPANAALLALELNDAMSRVSAVYPYQSGLAAFVAEPTLLAFLLGRAINPAIVESVYLTNFNAGKYEFAYALPFAERIHLPRISPDPADQLKRREVLDAFVEAIDELRGELKPEHILDDVLPYGACERFVTCLRELKHQFSDENDFQLHITDQEYAFGEGLLEALRKSTKQQQKDFAKLLFLHELLCYFHGIQPTSRFDVGRTSVVVEQIDFAAEGFALRVVNRIELEAGGPRALARSREILQRWLEASLHGLEAFDLMEQGTRMNRLPERRLRRYLTLHLQLARASTVRTAPDIKGVLTPTIAVDLAPVASHLDPQGHEKEVLHALPNTELFCAVGGYLLREAKRPGFDPDRLVDAVRTYSHAPLQQAMHFLIGAHKHVLVPWLP